MGEVNIHPCVLCQPFVVAHLGALVVGHRAPHLRLEAIEYLGEGFRSYVSLGAFQLDQGNEQSCPLDQSAHL